VVDPRSRQPQLRTFDAIVCYQALTFTRQDTLVMFRDYQSAYDELIKVAKKNNVSADGLASVGVDRKSYESVYEYEIRNAKRMQDVFASWRLTSELDWYRCRRPFFNVYHVIEKKFTALDLDIDMSELHLPFKTIEIRTTNRTILLGDMGHLFLFVVELHGASVNGLAAYQEFVCDKTRTLKSVFGGKHREAGHSGWFEAPESAAIDTKEQHRLIYVAVGTCLLAADKSVVQPIILNKHRKEQMTPAEVAEYAEKAINRTNRIGFDVGKDIERNKALVHYRNGCFAKYYVGKEHEAYPKNAETRLVPIIKWRMGAVVNKDNIPNVPTGFKGTGENDA